jgi:trehalose 6-phosphate phosphatase
MLDIDRKPDLQQFFDELSRARKSALLLDYDGTLSPFQLDRDEAYPYPGVSILLTEIMNTGHTRVVVITGRRAHEVVPLLGIDPHPEIWGAHGLQRLRPDGSCELPHLDEIATQALAEADSRLDGLGLHHLAEHKPGGLAVHWRGLPAGEQSDIRKIVSLSWLPVAHRAGMLFQEFDGGVEIRLPDRNKGDAVRSILNELPADAPVAYLGDDETDEDAFQALSDRGLRVLVRPQWRETAANVWLKPAAELLAFLCDWMEACRNAERPPLLTGHTHDRKAFERRLT